MLNIIHKKRAPIDRAALLIYKNEENYAAKTI
jgi:hypothetical protein